MLHDLLHSIAPLMWAGIAITAIILRHRRKMAAIPYQDIRATDAPTRTYAHTHAPGMEREMEQLRERIRVLERIATSSSLEGRSADQLSAEIEALRHA